MPNATFSTIYTGQIPGGPCPVCQQTGSLVAHHGTYDPEGQRTIVHHDPQTGVQRCTLPTAAGTLHTGPDARWRYEPNGEVS